MNTYCGQGYNAGWSNSGSTYWGWCHPNGVSRATDMAPPRSPTDGRMARVPADQSGTGPLHVRFAVRIREHAERGAVSGEIQVEIDVPAERR